MSLERRHFKRLLRPMPVVLYLGAKKVSCVTKNISKEGLCLELPIQKMPMDIFELLNKNVTMEIKDSTMDGIVKWYTVSESSYLIGISISKEHRNGWKDVLGHYMETREMSNLRNYFQNQIQDNIRG